MDITFSAANAVGLNNPGTEIITLVKDGSGNFINPPSYDKMRAYLSSGEVPMLFVTAEGGETGSLYQLVDYSETENKIRFGNDVNAIEFSAGAVAPAVSNVVPKPLTYDYMPGGYPSKTMGTVTVMEEQVVEFVSSGASMPSVGSLTPAFTPVEGQTYIVNWDGTEHECVCSIFNGRYLALGNLSIIGAGADTGEPFIYLNSPAGSEFETFDTAASHTISVKKTGEVVTPIAEEFLPVASEDTYGVVKKSEIVTSYEFDVRAPHDRMVEAITEFRAGRASIMWNTHIVVSAVHDPSTDEITVRFADVPYRLRASKNSSGFYNLNTTVSTYDSELILSSSTIGSTKNFKITVHDSGTISATEVI